MKILSCLVAYMDKVTISTNKCPVLTNTQSQVFRLHPSFLISYLLVLKSLENQLN